MEDNERVMVREVCPGIILDEHGRYYSRIHKNLAESMESGSLWMVIDRLNGSPVEMRKVK